MFPDSLISYSSFAVKKGWLESCTNNNTLMHGNSVDQTHQ